MCMVKENHTAGSGFTPDTCKCVIAGGRGMSMSWPESSQPLTTQQLWGRANLALLRLIYVCRGLLGQRLCAKWGGAREAGEPSDLKADLTPERRQAGLVAEFIFI